MKQIRFSSLIALLLVSGTLLALPTAAQGTAEGDDVDVEQGGFFIEIGTWIAQPTGVDLEPVTQLDSTSPFGTSPIAYSDSTDTELYYKFGYKLPKGRGKFSVWLYENDQDELSLSGSTPGVFQFGETLVNPLFAGVNLDGRADAFDSTARIKLNDFRFDYSRKAFENARVSADWFVGWRRIKFKRSMDANYYALIPGFPPLLPPLSGPIPALDPQVDSADISSSFEGRGLTAGMNFTVPLLTDRLRLEAGFAYSALRGGMDTAYSSTTWYYVLPAQSLPAITGDILLSAPYDAFDSVVVIDPQSGTTAPLATLIRQRRLQNGVQTTGRSSNASVLDLNLELRWRAIKGMEVILGFRNTRYDDVATDLRSETSISPLGTNNVTATLRDSSGQTIQLTSPELVFNDEGFTETKRSVNYEGFYIGVGYAF